LIGRPRSSSSRMQTETSKTPSGITSSSKPTIFIFQIGSLLRGRINDSVAASKILFQLEHHQRKERHFRKSDASKDRRTPQKVLPMLSMKDYDLNIQWGSGWLSNETVTVSVGVNYWILWVCSIFRLSQNAPKFHAIDVI
jgi:hypothetical protein